MILNISVDIQKLFESGKKYLWSRPEKCPRCPSRRIWGHGYVERYFEGFNNALWVKRYRCPDCKAVHTLRPKGFWKRFRHSTKNISDSLSIKINKKKWLKDIPRQNQQYWYKGLRFQSSRKFTIKFPTLNCLKRLLGLNIIPVSHSIQCEILRI